MATAGPILYDIGTSAVAVTVAAVAAWMSQGARHAGSQVDRELGS